MARVSCGFNLEPTDFANSGGGEPGCEGQGLASCPRRAYNPALLLKKEDLSTYARGRDRSKSEKADWGVMDKTGINRREFMPRSGLGTAATVALSSRGKVLWGSTPGPTRILATMRDAGHAVVAA